MSEYDLTGVIPAMVTPATDDGGDIDIARIKALTGRLIGAGVHGLFPCSSTGEAPLLDRDQRIRVIDAVADVNQGRLPLLAGVGTFSTAHAVRYARDAQAHGASHIVVLPLHFFRTSPAELEGYFAAVAESVDIPTILYNYPEITSGQFITPEMAMRLAAKYNIVGVKDSSGDLTLALRLIQACSADFAVFTGSESLLLALLSHGGAGTICAAANVIPEILVDCFDNFNRGELDVALEAQRKALSVSTLWRLGTFPAAVKACCGIADSTAPAGPPFLPAQPVGDEQIRLMRAALAKILDGHG